MEYLAILISVFLVSMILKLKYKIQLFKSVKKGLLLTVLLLVIGGLWDSYAILRGYWRFNRQFFIGISIGDAVGRVSFHVNNPLFSAGSLQNRNKRIATSLPLQYIFNVLSSNYPCVP